MRYLLDTNHWSYLQRRHPSVMRRVESLDPLDEIHMSVIVQAELRAGVELLPEGKRKQELRTVQQCTDLIPVDSKAAEQFALLLAQLRRVGRPVKTHDLWIAATAMVHGLTVVSNDEHFKCIAACRPRTGWISYRDLCVSMVN